MQDTERSKCTTRGAQKYYIRRCVEEGPEKSAFVTGGALFCIKFIGRNAKHVVALDTNTMQDCAGNGGQFGRTLGLRRAGSGGSRVGSHWADSSMPEQVSQILGIPPWCGGISFLWASMQCVYVRHGA